ncbi:hypothetical protein EDB85DRAFT_1896544 [Lactarius pseudohatsudake]|nr:hypothetical protein EDB85DRAFT_1896544 [Lactarius pseudohatsudake]
MSGQWHKALEEYQSSIHTVVSGHQSSAMCISHPSLDLYRIASEARPAQAQAHPGPSGQVEAGHVPGSRDGRSSGPIPKAPDSDFESGREIDRSPDAPLSRYPLGLLLLPILSLALSRGESRAGEGETVTFKPQVIAASQLASKRKKMELYRVEEWTVWQESELNKTRTKNTG